MRLRSHLVALVLAALVPVLGFTPLAAVQTAGHSAPGDT